jgi:hypothetical protein
MKIDLPVGGGDCYEPVRVETLLMKICHKKRKDVASPMMQVNKKSLIETATCSQFCQTRQLNKTPYI